MTDITEKIIIRMSNGLIDEIEYPENCPFRVSIRDYTLDFIDEEDLSID